MSLRSGTQKYGVESGRNPELEKILIDKKEKAGIEASKPLLDDNGNQVGSWLPISTPEPSWWVVESCDAQGCVPYAITPDGRFRPDPRITPDEAIKYLTRSLNFKVAEFELNDYRCDDNANPSWCQHAQQAGGYIGRIRKMIGIIKQAQQEYQQPQQGGFDIIPQVFAEEDPSVNSGLNGNYQESQVINYPQSANVRITFTSNIGMFSTSIPINDIGQLQILSNASNEWRYILIGHGSTNPPLMTLSGLINKINSMIASAVITPQPQPQPQPEPEPEPTTVHIPPPDMPPAEPPMVTVTPTEPGQVNWIPEPFFSFINNVFRR